MRPFTSTIPLDEARRRLDASVRPVDRIERVSLDASAGRVAAADVVSAMDVPPFARSAMDGYALVAADVAGASRSSPARLRIIDRIYTGKPSTAVIAPGTCAEISTGAPIPDGADAVVMVEETGRGPDNAVDVMATASAGQNIGRRAADIMHGDRVANVGDHLTPARVGALAAVGVTAVDVFAKPRVAILSTGNEVVEPGRTLAPGQIFDVNRFTLGAIVAAHGGVPEPLTAAEDTVEALVAALDAAASADLIVFSGGSSVGERDLVVDAIAKRGEMIFHGIAVRPGKPTAFARVKVPSASGTSALRAFFGMPGNPTSCLSNAYILLVPFLRAVARLPRYRPQVVRIPLGKRIVSAAGRHQFYTVRIDEGSAIPAFKGSGDITSLSRADGYIEIPADCDVVEEGTVVDVVQF